MRYLDNETMRLALNEILADYSLPRTGLHGVAHWARVMENGLRVAAATGADGEVVQLFAILHDSRRVNESSDPEHGPRAAEFAGRLQGHVFEISERQLTLLQTACAGHTHERTHPDITVQTCWDADRLDLARVGITPHPSRLCTEIAKTKEVINWAVGRGTFGVLPEFVERDWGVELEV